VWDDCHAGDIEWPELAKIQRGKLYMEEKLAVPESLVEEMVKEHHRAANQPGVDRLLRDLQQRYAFPAETRLREAVEQVRRTCMICQSCEPPNWRTK
jgi:hypothetical protein